MMEARRFVWYTGVAKSSALPLPAVEVLGRPPRVYSTQVFFVYPWWIKVSKLPWLLPSNLKLNQTIIFLEEESHHVQYNPSQYRECRCNPNGWCYHHPEREQMFRMVVQQHVTCSKRRYHNFFFLYFLKVLQFFSDPTVSSCSSSPSANLHGRMGSAFRTRRLAFRFTTMTRQRN